MAFIIYLEPNGILKQYCLDYFNSTLSIPNEAHQYPPHISLTGFFEADMEIISAVIDEIKANIHQLKPPTFYPPIKTAKSIIIPTVFAGETLISLKSIFPEIRVKRMDHISLAYLNHGIKSREFNGAELEELLAIASQTWTDIRNQEWDLVVYDVVKSIDLLQRHQFKELTRWTLSE
ncbi:hypothetical protein HDV01_006027 [Terramyces sp. JEL0728]|nr:hypothetical protein HDV01_006027 [Terramyces sp. JEL0728]